MFVHGNGILIETFFDGQGEAAKGCDLFRERADFTDRGDSHWVAGVAYVEAGADFAGDHIAGVGRDLERANGGDEFGDGSGVLFDRRDPFGSAGESITAGAHGSCSGMIGAALEDQFKAALTSNGGDGRERFVGRIEHGPLLDVKFEKCEGAIVDAGVRNESGIKAEILNCFAKRAAI